MPALLKRATPEGTEILKIPVGNNAFIASRLRDRISKMESVVNKLHSLEDPHVEFTLLRACLGSTKLAYALRGVPPTDDVISACREADDVARIALERLLGGSVGDAAWTQAGMKPSFGGMGLRHSEDIAVPAFLGSVVDTSGLVLSLLGKQSATMPGAAFAAQKVTSEHQGNVPSEVGIAIGCLVRGPITTEHAADFPTRVQAKLQEATDTTIHDRIRNMATANSRDRLDATKRKHASAWLAAFPNKALGLWLPPREFSAAARCWLGVQSQPEAKALLKPGLAMYGRHHSIQECLMSLCKSAGVAARREVLIDSSSNQRPADVYLPNWHRGVSYAVDVTVTNPSQSTHTSRDGVASAASASVRAARAKVALKESKYKIQCESHGVSFVAAAICCYGGWLEEGENIVNELAERCAVRGGRDLAITKCQFWQRLSIALWKGNACQLLHYAG